MDGSVALAIIRYDALVYLGTKTEWKRPQSENDVIVHVQQRILEPHFNFDLFRHCTISLEQFQIQIYRTSVTIPTRL